MLVVKARLGEEKHETTANMMAMVSDRMFDSICLYVAFGVDHHVEG